MSETPRTDAVPSEESRIKRLSEWARRALLREPGASIIERTVAEDVQHLEAKYQRDLAAERERADRAQEDAERIAWLQLYATMAESDDPDEVVAADEMSDSLREVFIANGGDLRAAIDAARRK